jgi:hypothetical protein
MSQAMTAYVNYKQYSLRYDLERGCFDCWYSPAEGSGRSTPAEGRERDNPMGCFAPTISLAVEGAGITQIRYGGETFRLEDYASVSFSHFQQDGAAGLSIAYGGGPAAQPALGIHFTLDDRGWHCTFACRGDLDIHVAGGLRWGEDMRRDTFAVSLDRQGPDLRCAHGPAASSVDRALFDRRRDAALELRTSSPARLSYDWEREAYRFRLNTAGQDYNKGFSLRVHEQVFARKFNVTYHPVNPRASFDGPPVGWMSWYAVQFDAGEEKVLENARWQAAHLRDYGANTIWVDWEWYHSNFAGVGPDGIDTFHPDPVRYPNGLAHVAAEIKQLGLIPALWIGASNDPSENEFIRAHPETVLVQKPQWCGQYFLDLTHPLVLDEYIPRAFGQILEWGYQALKWDCMPVTMQIHDQYHDRLSDPARSTEQALLGAVAAARETVGADFYMLYCSGMNQRDLSVAAAGFDAARIGGDIFRWEDFVGQCVAQVMKYYAFHNVAFLNDPDNVILRPEFNSYDQALSRLSFVSLLGLPVTLGDHLPDLPEERVELLRRGMPALTTHPMDVRALAHDLRVVKLNLAVCKPYGEWNVLDVFNLRDEESEVTVDLLADLHLPAQEGPYLVFDYWNHAFIGAVAERFDVLLRPCASRVFAVHKLLDRPQVISTSRHLSQGAVDLERLEWDAARMTLSGASRGIAGEAYEVVLYAPAGWRVLEAANLRLIAPRVWGLVFTPAETGVFGWSVGFGRGQ